MATDMVIRCGGSYSLFGKVTIATALFLLLLVGTLETGATLSGTMSLKGRPLGKSIHDKDLAGDEVVRNPELGRNFGTSKRKVPHGPDPIHNRRAGKSMQPPGLV